MITIREPEEQGFAFNGNYRDFNPRESAQGKPETVYYKENQTNGTFIVISKADYDRVMKSNGTNEYKRANVLNVKQFIVLMKEKAGLERATNRDPEQRDADDTAYEAVNQRLALLIVEDPKESRRKKAAKKSVR